MEYLIKSMLSMSLCYLAYIVFLKNVRMAKSNRYFLLISVVFSVIWPAISFDIGYTPVLNKGINQVSIQTNNSLVYGMQSNKSFTFCDLLNVIRLGLFSGIAFMFLRFVLNICRLYLMIHKSEKTYSSNIVFVMLNKEIIPYNFMKFIFVNKEDYENDWISHHLIEHEMAHCTQKHSIDNLIMEVIKIFLWFNPFVWIYHKAIQLNHEFLADAHVNETNSNINEYQILLYNTAVKHPCLALTSNFNQSFLKKRVQMMAVPKLNKSQWKRRLSILPVLLITLVLFAFNEKNIHVETNENWWQPILALHNIQPNAHNNFYKVFEMGETNEVVGDESVLTNAFVLINNDTQYFIIRAPKVYHNIKKNQIKCKDGTLQIYTRDEKLELPVLESETNFTKFDMMIDKHLDVRTK